MNNKVRFSLFFPHSSFANERKSEGEYPLNLSSSYFLYLHASKITSIISETMDLIDSELYNDYHHSQFHTAISPILLGDFSAAQTYWEPREVLANRI